MKKKRVTILTGEGREEVKAVNYGIRKSKVHLSWDVVIVKYETS